ncbi:MAG: hypothetical protein ACLUN5_02500 [Oscillospiraceae bacterium]
MLLEKIGGVSLERRALRAVAGGGGFLDLGDRHAARADAQLAMADASQFARGYYGALSEDYLQVYTYQLGLCLPLHVLAKLLSGPALGQLDFAAQCLNAALGIAGAGVLAALAQEIFEKRAASVALLLYRQPADAAVCAVCLQHQPDDPAVRRHDALLCPLCAHGTGRVRRTATLLGGLSAGRQLNAAGGAAGAFHLRADARMGAEGRKDRAVCRAVVRNREGVRWRR